MANLLEIAKRYGRLKPTGAWSINKHSRRMVECLCECGVVCRVDTYNLRTGKTQSCGCLRIKHGMSTGDSRHDLYTLWRSMKSRCYHPSHDSYKDYGMAGISVCDGWRDNFQAFHDWAMDNGWKSGLTIDRKNNNFGYTPANCRWVTVAEQNRNKRNNVIIEAFGERKCVADWIKDERCHVAFNTLVQRIRDMKMEPEAAISTKNMNHLRGTKSNAIYITYKGKKVSLYDICGEVGQDYKIARNRLYKGWDADDAIDTPKDLRKVNHLKTSS